MIVSDGNGRYGWKPRLLNGSVIRHTLSEAELADKMLHWDVDARDALWPTFFAPEKYGDPSPAKLALPNDRVAELAMVHLGHGLWGSSITLELFLASFCRKILFVLVLF